MRLIDLWQAGVEAGSARCRLERPNLTGEGVEEGRLRVAGWAAAADRRLVAVELLARRGLVGFAEAGIERPDLAAAFPGLPGAGRSGFRCLLPTAAVTGEESIQVDAVFDDGTRLRVGGFKVAPEGPQASVSVVIPCFRQAHFLGEALDSVLNQTRSGLEVLVVDDGSDDNAAAVSVRGLGVEYVRQENSGLAAARNAGVERTGGDHIVFLDADDRLLPGAIETGLIEFQQAEELGYVAGECREIAPDGSPLPSEPEPRPDAEAYPALLSSCFIRSASNVMYSRSALEEIGGFDVAHSASADYLAYLEIARRLPVRFHDGVVVEYRRHGSNMTRDFGAIIEAQLGVLRSQKAWLRTPELRAAYKEGISKTKAQNGPQLAMQAATIAAEQGLLAARRHAGPLARRYPRGIGPMVTRYRELRRIGAR